MNWRTKILNYIASIFNDDKGNTSLMRWLSVGVVAVGLVYPFTVEKLTLIDSGFATSLITLGMGAKFMQKKVETK